MKAMLEQLFRTTLDDIAIDKVLPQRVLLRGSTLQIESECLELDDFDRIVVAALGKAAGSMTASLAGVLAPRQIGGIVVGPVECQVPGIVSIVGEHPYPGAGSARAAAALLELASGVGENDLFICLLSGGGSSLAEMPLDDSVSMSDLNTLHQMLVTCGADIVAMNVVRKHLSAIKGGRLAQAAAPARQLTLYVSDVPPDEPETVASGPTMPDSSTAEDAAAVITRYGLMEKLPASIRTLFGQALAETPKPDETSFARSTWHCLLDNAAAVKILRDHAKAQGWVAVSDCTVDDWPLAKAADTLLERLELLLRAHPGQPVCLVSGGELSCPVTGDGSGGRNQAFVLHVAQQIAGANIAVLSAGSDGIDGNSPAAGALADGATIERATGLGLDAATCQRHSDSFHFFQALGDAIMTGVTGNNVRDLRILLRT